MNRKTNPSKNAPSLEENLDEQIYDALLEKGWLIPQTEEDLRHVEAYSKQEDCSPLPPELADPYALFPRLDEIAEEELGTGEAVTLRDVEPDQHPVLIQPNESGVAKAAGATPTNHVSLLADLRELTGLQATQIAHELDVTVPFLSSVGRHPKVVPLQWWKELDTRAARNLNLSQGTLMRQREHPYQAQMAASRDSAYEVVGITYEELLEQSGMDEDAKRYWLTLAAAEES